ncbi:hypothetical protein ACHAWF_018660 [Thalassiosira exigua]
MGLTYPSDDPTDHYLCGRPWDHASEHCATPCPDGTSLRCKHAEYCFLDTSCDFRVLPTKPPTERPTPAPVPYERRENYSFCGDDWFHANTCAMKWCGDGGECPEDQDCFADTTCNVLDREPLPPTTRPSGAPVHYDDDSNYFFCGASYLEAVEYCSVETHCTGDHRECGPGKYCWSGVSCNIQDLRPPTPPRTSSPTRLTPDPTRSPIVRDAPENTRFYGSSWSDASGSCKEPGAMPRWCPKGSDDECDEGETCWADTTCNVVDFTFPPSLQPTDDPVTSSPTDRPIQYNDPINTSFCGSSYLDAEASCSIETHCPSGQHSDCPGGSYCWTVSSSPTCNILHIIGPTLPPTRRPSQSPTTEFKPSVSPTFRPTSNPTGTPTATPLQESDERRSLYCRTTWSDASSKCDVGCPHMTGCPPGEKCFGHTMCSKKPDVDPTLMPTNTITATPLTLSPTEPLETPHPSDILGTPRPTELLETPRPTPGLEESDFPTTPGESIRATPVPTMPPTWKKNVPLPIVPNPPTISPFAPVKAEVQIAHFPYVPGRKTPKPPAEIVLRIQHIINSVRSSLEKDIFVIEVRSGALIPSSLYTFEGFLASLTFYSNVGVNEKFFYLGEYSNDQIEYGIANLSLFLAKMMDTVAVERCDPDNISCGIPALDDIFHESIRVECSQVSPEAGMEYPSSTGCVCALGALNEYIGARSPSTSGAYSGVDFCETSLLRSICSRRINQGEELRWIAAMTYHVFFVQQYADEKGWNFVAELRKFVRGGMLDMNFVSAVAGLSVLDTGVTAGAEVGKFVRSFFKAMTKLSEGISSPIPLIPHEEIAPPTTSPSGAIFTVENLVPKTSPPATLTADSFGFMYNPTDTPSETLSSPTDTPFHFIHTFNPTDEPSNVEATHEPTNHSK